MNLALLDPFSHNELPEVIEAKLEVPSTVSVCAFNRRGSMLAGGCDNGHVIVWDFETHGVARTLELHEAPVTSVSWTKSSRRLLSSGADGRLAVWDVLGACVVQLLARENLEFTGASTHPLRRDVCLACSSSTVVAFSRNSTPPSALLTKICGNFLPAPVNSASLHFSALADAAQST